METDFSFLRTADTGCIQFGMKEHITAACARVVFQMGQEPHCTSEGRKKQMNTGENSLSPALPGHNVLL